MNSPTTDAKIIDLSDATALTPEEIAQRKEELQRIEMKLEALHVRQYALIKELGIGGHSRSSSPAGLIDSALFLDEAADIFRDAPEPARSKDSFADLDINDSEFDTRFATFVSADVHGDHKARRWLGKA